MPRTVAEFGEPRTQHTTMVAVLNPILSRLEKLLERCHELPLQAHYQRPWGPAWAAMMDAIDPHFTKKTSPGSDGGS